MMKKLSTTIILCLAAIMGMSAQTTIIDFENPADYQIGGWEGVAEVVTNPNTGGINTSANVGKYTTPSGKAWNNGVSVVMNTAYNYKDVDHIQFMVLAPSATKMFVKLESTSNGSVAEAYATPINGSDWQLVTLNFSALDGVDEETATFDKFFVIFNVDDNVGNEEWLFDNVAIYEEASEPEAPTNLQVSNVTSDSFTLTWDNDPKATGGTNIFIVEEAISSGDVYIATVAEGVSTYSYQGTYGAVTIQEGGTYLAKLQALPDADWNAYAQLEVNTTSTDIDNEMSQEEVQVYPNPVKDILTIDVKSAKVENVQVFNSLGKLVKTLDTQSQNQKVTIPFSDLSAGVYFVKIQLTGADDLVKRIVKH